jgi:hypothetical protein
MKLTKMKTNESEIDNYNQKLFELKLDLLYEYKKLHPNKKVYLTEDNLNMVLQNYKQFIGK